MCLKNAVGFVAAPQIAVREGAFKVNKAIGKIAFFYSRSSDEKTVALKLD
jgi:hypothetical protein